MRPLPAMGQMGLRKELTLRSLDLATFFSCRLGHSSVPVQLNQKPALGSAREARRASKINMGVSFLKGTVLGLFSRETKGTPLHSFWAPQKRTSEYADELIFGSNSQSVVVIVIVL